jgi:hypothetical protein
MRFRTAVLSGTILFALALYGVDCSAHGDTRANDAVLQDDALQSPGQPAELLPNDGFDAFSLRKGVQS